MGEEEGGLVLLAGAAHVADQEEGGSGGAPRRSTPADRAARVKRGRAIVAAVDDVADAPAPKRHRGGAQVGPSGRHGVYERTEEWISMGTSCLTWRAGLCVAGHKSLHLGGFPTVDDAARAYDAEVRRRGWAHVRPLNFPQPEEVAAYTPHAGERCDERGLPVSLALEPPAVAQSAAAAYGAANQRSHSTQKPGKSGFFGVTRLKSKASPCDHARAQHSGVLRCGILHHQGRGCPGVRRGGPPPRVDAPQAAQLPRPGGRRRTAALLRRSGGARA